MTIRPRRQFRASAGRRPARQPYARAGGSVRAHAQGCSGPAQNQFA